MARDLAAEDRALVAHPRLEERVADAIDVGACRPRLDGVGDGARCAGVVEDVGGLGALGEQVLGKDRRQEVAVDEAAAVVDEEAAIGVAVPGDPEIGAALRAPRR